MPFHPQFPIQERILMTGDAGSGKSTGILNIAKFAALTKSTAQFYIADTDFAMARMLPSYPQILDRVHIDTCYDWNDLVQFQRKVLTQARPTDWVSIDFIGSAWQYVQSFYVEEIFKKNISNYFIQVRKDLAKDDKTLGALEGWTDWTVINKVYKEWINPLLFKGKYHLYATAKSTQLSSDKKPTEDSNTRQLFARFNVKPEGQKDLPYQFHTVLLCGYDVRSGRRTITTVKDREREEVRGLEIKNFAMDYLKGIGGWVM